MSWEEWVEAFNRIAYLCGFPDYATTDEESFKEYWADGDSPQDAWDMEVSYFDPE